MDAPLDDRVTYAPFSLIEYQSDRGTYFLALSDGYMVEREDVFLAAGREPNGYGWAAVANRAMGEIGPGLGDRLELDPEAGMFVARGSDLDALTRLAEALHLAFHDEARLAALIGS